MSEVSERITRENLKLLQDRRDVLNKSWDLDSARRNVIARHAPKLCCQTSFAKTDDDKPMCALCGYPEGYPMHQDPYER